MPGCKPEVIEVNTGYSGKKVAVVGMGKSNQALSRYLIKNGARVTCFDRKNASQLGSVYSEFTSYGATWSLGEDYLKSLDSFDAVFLTPGMKKNLPEIVRARENGAVITSETELFLERCCARVIGITGSSGKTTTCMLTALMLEKTLGGSKVWVGGNIGSVLIEYVDDIPRDHVVVLELSSFQLELANRSPYCAGILNVRPNHLDIHDNFENYLAAKKNVFTFQGSCDWCILNMDDQVTAGCVNEISSRPALYSLDQARFGNNECEVAAWTENKKVLLRDSKGKVHRIAETSDYLIPGFHNVSNSLMAVIAAYLSGSNFSSMTAVIREFAGVEHRIEFVRELDGVKYYNDSIATTPDRTQAFINSVDGELVLIMGGYDKGLSFDQLAKDIAAKPVTVITIGTTADKIRRSLRRHGVCEEKIIRASDLEEAINIARNISIPGGSVALSPACASFDMFSGFEERGNIFKDIVRRLK